MKPGDSITWKVYDGVNPPTTRTGVVWSGAPQMPGWKNSVWVVPDAPAPGDPFYAFVVATASKGHTVYVYSTRLNESTGPVSLTTWDQPMGSLMRGAATRSVTWQQQQPIAA